MLHRECVTINDIIILFKTNDKVYCVLRTLKGVFYSVLVIFSLLLFCVQIQDLITSLENEVLLFFVTNLILHSYFVTRKMFSLKHNFKMRF